MERILTAKAQALLATAGATETEEQRKARRLYLKEDRFVTYELAQKHVAILKDMLETPEGGTQRPDCLALIGEPNSGKSGLLTHFVQAHAAPVDDPKEPAARIPALYVIMRGNVDEDRIYRWILDALSARYKENDRPDKRFRMVEELVERLSIQMLILDEFHHILAQTANKRRTCLNVVKTLISELRIPIVVGGIPEVSSLLGEDSQIASRFESITLPRWEYTVEYRQFLAGLEVDYPLLEASNLGDKNLSTHIYNLSEGLIGESVKLLRRAAVKAVGNEEKITLEGINALNPVPPSQRRQKAADEVFRRDTGEGR